MDESENRSPTSKKPKSGAFVRLGMALSDWSEQWFPDTLVFALLAVIIVFVAGLALKNTPGNLAKDFGDGFWGLMPFTMQMTMIIIGGYVVASSPPVARMIRWLAAIPRTPRGAVSFVALFGIISSLINWGFGLIFTGLLTLEVVRRMRDIDYRSISAAAYVGSVSVATLGLTSSAALLMATRESIPPAIFKVSGMIPLTRTIFLWQSIVTVVIVSVATVWVAYLSAPHASDARTAESFGVNIEPNVPVVDKRRTPGEWFEYNGLLTVLICIIGFGYLIQVFHAKGLLAAIDLNTYNFLFIITGMLLHWRPRAFVQAVASSVPATAGVLIQFPFYAGIFGMLTKSTMSTQLARIFIRISTPGSYPLLVSVYSALLGLFLPSAGGKWVVEAPYLLDAANQFHANTGWIVQVYSASEALPLLVNPFFMLPLLGVLKLRARELVGYSVLQLAIHLPLVLFLMWLFARTFPSMAEHH
jgi:short-chain fatty acids transporter